MPLEAILGLAYLDGGPSVNEGRQSDIVHNPRRPDIHDLDALPFPAWDLVDVRSATGPSGWSGMATFR